MPTTITVRSGVVGSKGTVYRAQYQQRPGIPDQFTRRVSIASASTSDTVQPSSPNSPVRSPRPATPSPPRVFVPPTSSSNVSVYSFPSGALVSVAGPEPETEPDVAEPPAPSVPRHYRAKALALRILRPILGIRLTRKLVPPLRELIDRP